MANDDMQARVKVAERLLRLFKFERFAYLLATILALLFLVSTAVVLVVRESYTLAFGMFGSCGIITITIGRLLRLWNQVFMAILGPAKPEDRHDT
jgi:membrane-bound ClpP family serine protease